MEHYTICVDRRRAELYAPSLSCQTVVYLHGGSGETEDCISLLEGTEVALVLLPDVDWNGELSPWPAQKVFRGGEDFSGKAAGYLRLLTESIIPQTEAMLKMPVMHRGIAGYSLAGLFAVYALWESSVFDRAASMSGSLWYDGFSDYFLGTQPAEVPKKVYLSLGEQEKRTRNPRMAQVENATELLYQRLLHLGTETVFIHHPGGHFRDVSQRIQQGILWILE